MENETIKKPIRTKSVKIKIPKNPSEDKMYVVDMTGVLVFTKSGEQLIPEGYTSLENFIDFMQVKKPISTKILPKDCIIYNSNFVGDKVFHLFVIQKEPFVYNIKFDKNKLPTDASKYEYNIGLPYVISFILLQEFETYITNINTTILAAKHPIVSMDDRLYNLPLNNLDENGVVCWGNDAYVTKLDNESPGQYAHKILNTFFTLKSNRDLPFTFDEKLKSWDDWEEKTKINNTFLLDEKSFLKENDTVSNILNKLMPVK